MTGWIEFGGQRNIVNLVAFGTYAITVACQIRGSGSKLFVRSLFDKKVVTISQTQRILKHFTHVIIGMETNLDICLASIPSISRQDMGELMI